MASADFFMAPAPFGESYGLVLAEAMAAGAIPIAAANAGYASVLKGGGGDLLAQPGDPISFADRCIAIAQARERQHELRVWANAQARLSDVTRAGPKYLEVYQKALVG